MELIAYSQRDERWAIDQLGFCENVTIGKKGCGLVCISILAGLYPDQANEILKERGGYSQGCVMKWDKAAEIFNLPRTDNFPKVAEVKLSGQQHFIIMLDERQALDPIDGKLKTNPYKILSWRNINPKQNGGTMSYSEPTRDEIIEATIDGINEFVFRIPPGDRPWWRNQAGQDQYVAKDLIKTMVNDTRFKDKYNPSEANLKLEAAKGKAREIINL